MGRPSCGQAGTWSGEHQAIHDAEGLFSTAPALDLLAEAGFITIEMQGGGGVVMVGDITWAGHDFLDAVREPQVWAETKSRAEKVGGWTVGILTDIAKGYIKAKAAEHGFPLG